MQEWLPRLLFIFAIMAVAFGYGFVSHQKEIFPYRLLHDGYVAFDALMQLGKDSKKYKNLDYWDDSGITRPTYSKLSSDAGDEAIFVLGNELTYRDAESGLAYLAWLADREGNILHAWKDPGEIWRPLENRQAIGNAWRSYPVGAHYFPNGDILVSYHGVDVFPVPMGLAKFDKDSRLIWKRNGFYHHWFSVGPEGEIYVPDLELGSSPLQIEDHEKVITCNKAPFPYDSIAVLDSDGNKIREIDLLTALIRSDLTGLFNNMKPNGERIETCDPMHLNDVQVLTGDRAAEYPEFSPGDLLVSFRNLNGIGVLDPESELFKWFYVGAAHHQHSPRYYKKNSVLLFDNYGGPVSRGISRVLSIDVARNVASTLFPAAQQDLPLRQFFSDTAGHMDVHPSGSRLLASWTHQGLIWEIDAESGEVLWELVNTHPLGARFGRISVYTAQYAGEMDFEPNHGALK